MAKNSNSTIDGAAVNATEWAAMLVRYEEARTAAHAASIRADIIDQSYEAMMPAEPRRGLVIQSRGECFSLDQANRNALLSREAWQDACANLRGLIGIDDAHEECDRLCAIVADEESKLMRMPSPDLAALKWKLDKLLDTSSDGALEPWTTNYVDQARADIARFAAQ